MICTTAVRASEERHRSHFTCIPLRMNIFRSTAFSPLWGPFPPKRAWNEKLRPEEDDDALSAVAEEETVAESAMPATKLSNLPKVVSAVETGKSAESPEGKQGGERSAEAESIMKVTISTSSSSAPPPLFPPDGEQETATPSVSSSSSTPSGSRMICLRALRPGGEGAGKAQAAATAAAEAAAAAVAKEMTVGAGKPSTGALVGAVVSNKVVDLREVKKVRPVVLTPITVATEASVASSSDDEAGGGGSVKVDLSAGKRMIEFQLKVNAAEEKREAARLKSERDRAGQFQSTFTFLPDICCIYVI